MLRDLFAPPSPARRKPPRRARRPVVESLEDRRVPAVLPPGFAESVVASGLVSPTAMELAPDGRLFVAEQGGRLRVVKDGALLPVPFVSLGVDSTGERGLLGVAFDPNFAANRYVYVYYTVPGSPAHNRISRFTADGDVARPGSEAVILELDDLSGATNHNGGAIHFGADGRLYVGVGDNANGANAQTLSNLHGKVLRINPDPANLVPSDNPFVGSATGNNRAIWALGLRNPFTFAVQPGTGRLFVNDVGQVTWEEINDGVAGSNYGWPATEGPTTDPRFRAPLFAYPHSGPDDQSGCAISGGAFYNPSVSTFPADYSGDYFFADFCNNWVRRYDTATGRVDAFAADLPGFTVDLKVHPDGSLYALSRGGGGVVTRFQFTANQGPTITRQPTDQAVGLGQSATFTVVASGTAPLAYRWQRNGVDIPGATAPSYTLASASPGDQGARFRAIVANAFGAAVSNEAVLTVLAGQAPTAAITAPDAGARYVAGRPITFSGRGIDPEDGPLPPSAMTWQVDFHHDNHVHPFLPPGGGFSTGGFVVPDTGETSPNVFYRVSLTVRDSTGLTHTTFRDIRPRTATVRLAANLPGLTLTLDGQPIRAPSSFIGVVGMRRTIEAVSPQVVNGRTFVFRRWADGGPRAREIVIRPVTTIYRAAYRRANQVAPRRP